MKNHRGRAAARTDTVDCVIIGAGPVGLTAALHLARYRRSVRVFNAGESRAELIPVSHNFPGFPTGISGTEFLGRLRRQVHRFGAEVEEGRVDDLSRMGGLFRLRVNGTLVSAQAVILATGVEDRKPDIPGWHEATLAGVIRWCPICDGYEATDRVVAVWSKAREGLQHGRFLRTYTREVTLVLEPGEPPLQPQQRRGLAEAGIAVIADPVVQVTAMGRRSVMVETADGRKRSFDCLYPMIGSEPRIALLSGIEVQKDSDCSLIVDQHQRTSMPGLYAAGDVVRALNQISIGAGHATAAAMAVHRMLPPNYR